MTEKGKKVLKRESTNATDNSFKTKFLYFLSSMRRLLQLEETKEMDISVRESERDSTTETNVEENKFLYVGALRQISYRRESESVR